MITDFLLQILYFQVLGITLLISNFGEVSENNLLTSSIVVMRDYYMSLNEYLPLNIILAIVAFELVFEGFVFLYKMIRWGYRKIPGIS